MADRHTHAVPGSHWRLDRRPRRRWARSAVGALAVWVTIVVTMVLFEESMIYFPDPYPSGSWDAEALARTSGATVRDCFFTAADGTRLHAWWCRPAEEDSAGQPTAGLVLLWFHGNAGNLSQRSDMLLDLAALPTQVLIIDYRGYGRSEGRPTEKGLYLDARAAWSYLTGEAGVPAGEIVLFGKSLGGAVAIDLATEVDPAGLVVQSSFTSLPDMAAHHYPFIPRFLVRTRLDSLSKIGRVRCPVLVIHSPSDEIVPFAHGRMLFEAAQGEKRFHEVPGAAHNETWLVGGRVYLDVIRRFMIDCRDSNGAPGGCENQPSSASNNGCSSASVSQKRNLAASAPSTRRWS